MTAYLMALDDRIAVAAPSCYITSLERLFATIGPQDAEQNITGQVAAGMEHADYVTMRAPKPTLADRRHPRLLRHPGELGHVPRGQADLRPAGLRRAGRPVRVGRAARLHPARAGSPPPAGCGAGCSSRTRPSTSPISRSPPTPSCNAPRPARSSATSRTSPSSTSTPSGRASCAQAREAAGAKRSDAEFRAEVRKLLGLERRQDRRGEAPRRGDTVGPRPHDPQAGLRRRAGDRRSGARHRRPPADRPATGRREGRRGLGTRPRPKPGALDELLKSPVADRADQPARDGRDRSRRRGPARLAVRPRLEGSLPGASTWPGRCSASAWSTSSPSWRA